MSSRDLFYRVDRTGESSSRSYREGQKELAEGWGLTPSETQALQCPRLSPPTGPHPDPTPSLTIPGPPPSAPPAPVAQPDASRWRETSGIPPTWLNPNLAWHLWVQPLQGWDWRVFMPKATLAASSRWHWVRARPKAGGGLERDPEGASTLLACPGGGTRGAGGSGSGTTDSSRRLLPEAGRPWRSPGASGGRVLT